MFNILFVFNQSTPEHFKPTQEELDRLQQSRIPSNTLQNTNKWIRILNDWREAVGYNYLLESLDDKDKIEKEVSEFIVGAKTKQNQVYSRSSLKNAVAGISRHLRNVKKDWNYNLCKKEHFPKLLYIKIVQSIIDKFNYYMYIVNNNSVLVNCNL